MSDRKLRWLGLGLVTTAGAGVLGLTAMMNPAFAHADGDDIGLVLGASGLPIPGSLYVAAADGQYLDNPGTTFYPDLTFYQATSTVPSDIGFYGNGVFTPEGLYPLTGAGVHQLYLNYPTADDGFPALSSSVGQGMAILESTIAADTAAGDTSTVFGYSQSSTIASYVMEQLDPSGTPQPDSGLQFLLVADPSNPNGGALERFAGFETTSGQTVSDPLSLPSLGFVFDNATPSDDYVTSIYSLEYDGFADFPRYPLNFLSDLNAFLGIATLHGTYLNGFEPGNGGPTAAEIAGATLLPGSAADGTADSLTNYYMIDETPPLVALLPQPLQDLLGPDLTYLINLGYGDGSLGYSVTPDSPANVPTPFGLFPDVSLSTVLSTLATDTEQGITAFGNDLSDPAALLASLESSGQSFTDLLSALSLDAADPTASLSSLDPASSGQSLTDVLSALSADAADPAATLTDLVNATSSAASTAYSTLLPLADIGNALLTSIPSYDLSLFTDNLANGDLVDALGLPIAANTGLDTLIGGFALAVVANAASQISADFSGLF
jgi:PE-PPE domain